MKTITINLSEYAFKNEELLAHEIAAFLSKLSDNTDFDVDGKEIIEYDLTEKTSPIYWTIDSVKKNAVNYTVNLDC